VRQGHRAAVVVGGVTVAFLASACGSSSKATSSATTAATASQGSSSSVSASAGKCSGKVIVGVEVPLSGPIADVGVEYLSGIKIGVSDVNASGGVNGKCVSLDTQDTGGNPTTAAQLARQLIQSDGAKFLIGPILSSEMGAVAPIATAAGIPEFSITALAAAGDAKQYPYLYRTNSNTVTNSQATANFVQSHHWTSVGIIEVNNAYGTENGQDVQQDLKAMNIKVTGMEVAVSGGSDFSSEISKLKSGRPQAIFVAMTGLDVATSIKGRNTLGWNVPVIAPLTTIDPAVIGAVGSKGMNDVYAGPFPKTITYTASGPATSAVGSFQAKYKAANGGGNITTLLANPAFGYDGVALIQAAANGAQSISGSAVKTWLDTHPFTGLVSYAFSSTDHNGVGLQQVTFANPATLKNGLPEAAS
jgi:branched-chain amino acid transport system substrate-binding protein